MTPLAAASLDVILDDLAGPGWSVQPAFVPEAEVDALIAEAQGLWREGDFRQAGIGAGAGHAVRPEIRSDRIYWLDPQRLPPAAAAYWARIDALRGALNRSFYLGLQDFEAHFAVYPPGSFYRRHLDQPRGGPQRLISCLLYLNDGWQASDGGQLRLYHDAAGLDAFTDVFPCKGTFVCFRSDTVYHEVLPTGRERFSLTGWLRRAA